MVSVQEVHQVQLVQVHVEVHLHGVVHQVLVRVLGQVGEVRQEVHHVVLVHHGVAVQEVHHVVHSVEVEEDNHEIRIITKRQG